MNPHEETTGNSSQADPALDFSKPTELEAWEAAFGKNDRADQRADEVGKDEPTGSGRGTTTKAIASDDAVSVSENPKRRGSNTPKEGLASTPPQIGGIGSRPAGISSNPRVYWPTSGQHGKTQRLLSPSGGPWCHRRLVRPVRLGLGRQDISSRAQTPIVKRLGQLRNHLEKIHGMAASVATTSRRRYGTRGGLARGQGTLRSRVSR